MRRRRPWSSDTISRWFAVNIVAAVITAACMNALFVQFAGVWAKPSLYEVGIIDEAVTVVRVLEGAPPSLRPRLSKAAGNDDFEARWYPNGDALPMSLANATFHSGQEKVRRLLGRPTARAVAYEPGDTGPRGELITHYMLGIGMSDGSWVQFIAPERSWGISPFYRGLLIAGFVLLCSLVVAAFSSRRLARPMEQFARQAKRFGTDVNATPILVSGPIEFRVAAQAFNDMQARIQRHVTGRTEMLAAISHDLRAPLTRMRLRGEFIEDEEQQRRLFRDVDEMQAMVDSSLQFFREEGTPEESTRFHLTELVNTLVDDFRDEGHDVTLLAAPPVTFTGRPLSIRRALSNLMENAVKYGACAVVGLEISGRWITIVIEDKGPGIPADQQDAVFRPFYRMESSRNRSTGGVGLGLAAARSAAREHGGDITLSNRREGGLRACLQLPVV